MPAPICGHERPSLNGCQVCKIARANPAYLAEWFPEYAAKQRRPLGAKRH